MDYMEIVKIFGPWLMFTATFLYSWGKLATKVEDIAKRQDRFEAQILVELRDIKLLMAQFQSEMLRHLRSERE